MRGRDLTDVRRRALDRLNEHNVSTTLVVTLKKGLNDDEIGETIEFALKQPCVRGVTFQPVQDAGRTEDFDNATDRLTLGEVRQQILAQTDVFKPHDVVPVPCPPDCLAMAYALKYGDRVVPLTGLVDPKILLHGEGNTIVYEKNDALRAEMFKLFSTAASPLSSATSLKQLLCCLPLAPGAGRRRVPQRLPRDRDEVHGRPRPGRAEREEDVRPHRRTRWRDGKHQIIPFDTYNLLYRDGRRDVLEALRRGEFDERPRRVLTPLTVKGATA